MDSEVNLPTVDPWSVDNSFVVEVHSIPKKGWLRTFERFEASAGLMSTMLLGVAPVILGAVGTIALLNDGALVLAFACGCWTMIAAGLATLAGAICSQAVRACFPEWADDPITQLHLKPDHLDRFHPASSFAIETALSFPRFPQLLRPLLAVWWLLHFMGGALTVLALHQLIGGNIALTIPGLLLAAGCQFSFLLGANVYLVMSVAAFSDDESLLSQIWSHRFAVDLFLTGLVLLYCL